MPEALRVQSIEIGTQVWGAEFTRKGLCRLHFPPWRPQHGSHVLPYSQNQVLRRWLMAYWDPASPPASHAPPLPELDLSAGTGFQQAVWRALMQIPYGATQTYGELALRIGKPGASRAVGTACGRNPVPVLVPCHRVVASGGKLGGFSAGLSWKRTLLNLEASRPGMVPQSPR
ncbi:MAG: methylated-DNA--[protein]-cysteine S-methyltransferase [Limisphaerales bacterium]